MAGNTLADVRKSELQRIAGNYQATIADDVAQTVATQFAQDTRFSLEAFNTAANLAISTLLQSRQSLNASNLA